MRKEKLYTIIEVEGFEVAKFEHEMDPEDEMLVAAVDGSKYEDIDGLSPISRYMVDTLVNAFAADGVHHRVAIKIIEVKE